MSIDKASGFGGGGLVIPRTRVAGVDGPPTCARTVAPNGPDEIERARRQLAGYVATTVEASHQAETYGLYADMLGLT